ncbi:MAG: type VI secretion system tube protein Hcp [Bryobacterales bacterium]|nr:type VI secretion system tube protein Hcp [Bryobacterales bacterium]
MALDYFIKIDQIPGESTDEKHKDEIEVLSFEFGMKHGDAGSSSTGGARTAGRVSHKPFTFTKITDKASAKLLEKCCNGTHIPKAVFTAHRATGDKQKYLQIELTDLIVSSFYAQIDGQYGGYVERAAGSAAGGGVMLTIETVSLNYGSIKYIYTATDHKTGKPAGDVQAGWDLVANKKI